MLGGLLENSDIGPIAVVAVLVLLASVVFATGTGSAAGHHEGRVDVVSGTGVVQFDSLSENATDRLRPAFENGTDAVTVNKSSYDTVFPTFPAAQELLGDNEYRHVRRGDRFYRIDLEAVDDRYRVRLSEYTDTVRIEYENLSRGSQMVIAEAESTDGPINVTEMPRFGRADGLSGGILGGTSAYYLWWDGEYYTVVTYEPVEFVETPNFGAIFVGIVFAIFLIGLFGYLLRAGDG